MRSYRRFFCLVPPRIKCSFPMIDRAKLMLRVLRSYIVYYQTNGEEMISYCFFKRSYLCKYTFLKKRDVLINPYYVAPAYCGQGFDGS